jgi:fructose-bisphosphate aldolase class I
MSAFTPLQSPYKSPYLCKNKFEAELIENARKIATPGKGILAADESTGTIGTRFDEIKVTNNHENRIEYRRLLFTTPNLNQYISGVILFEETLYDKDPSTGKLLVQPLKDSGIVLGIKVDQGTKHLPATDNETYTQGLTDLDVRCKKYYEAGCRFAKWRAVLRISENCPSQLSIKETANSLASYAAICQANGLVPVVEPEILMDGAHTLEICQYWTEKVVSACYHSLSEAHVILEGTLLKPNMVLPGKQSSSKASPDQIAKATVQALQRSTPPAVPGITFLSGGQSEEDATVNLNAMNALNLGPRPWRLSFSYGRALQKTVLKVWGGKKENVKKAQEALLVRARANGLASIGKYTGDANSAEASKSSYVKDYKY